MKRPKLCPTLYPALHPTLSSMFVVLLLCAAPALIWAAKVGEAAPDFTATASNGRTVRLSDYRGKFVVLEWHNNGCPFVRKQYNSGNMQRLQKEWTSQGVVWFTILSSAPGKQGYATPSEENEFLAKEQAAPTAALLDPSGAIGHLYDARNVSAYVRHQSAGRDHLRWSHRRQTDDRRSRRSRREELCQPGAAGSHGRKASGDGSYASLWVFGEVFGLDSLGNL